MHLQFTPKYRRDVFRDERVKETCVRSFRRTAEELGVVLHAVEFGPEHCHLFVGACKNHSVAQLAQRLKGASARKIRRELKHAIEAKLWGEAFWSSGYHKLVHRTRPTQTLESPRPPSIQRTKTENTKPIHELKARPRRLQPAVIQRFRVSRGSHFMLDLVMINSTIERLNPVIPSQYARTQI